MSNNKLTFDPLLIDAPLAETVAPSADRKYNNLPLGSRSSGRVISALALVTVVALAFCNERVATLILTLRV